MATLNQISSQIAHTMNRPYDHVLKERIKDSVKYVRSMLIKQSFDKGGIDTYYFHRYIAELIKVDKIDACGLDSNCIVLRSKNKIPTPIRYRSDSIFASVETVDGFETFSFSDLGHLKYMASLRYAKPKFYDYRNQYLYLYISNKLKYIAINAAYEDFDLTDDCDSSGICYTDDMEFPVTGDMLTRIKDILYKTEFRITPIVDEEVKITDNDKTEPNIQ